MPAPTEPPVGPQPLRGGTANQGRVLRVGDTVHRPTGPYTPAVHALLDHLQQASFRGSPHVVARDGGTEVLRYIPGEAATEPVADWALTDSALAGVGELLREYHRCVAGFDSAGLTWQRAVPARWRDSLITHNDLNPANVIFRAGRPVAFIDFDLAAPGSAGWDLAVTACFWVPLRAGPDIDDGRRDRVPERFRLLLDSYGADAAERRDAALATPEANEWIAAVIEEAAGRGHPAFGRLWQHAMGMHRRAAAWLAANVDELLRAGS